VRRVQRRIRRTRRGDFELRLTEPERAILRSLPAQLRELLSSDDPALERIFPPAYPNDEELNDEYDRLVRGDLLAHRLGSIEVMERTIDSPRLDEEQLLAWLEALNDLRLVLGSRLGVTEEPDPDDVADKGPDAQAFALYYYLSWLVEQVVEELAHGIDPRGSVPD
jgi:hypothetical protein